METDKVTCSRFHWEAVSQPELTPIQSFNRYLQSPRPPACRPLRCQCGLCSSFPCLGNKWQRGCFCKLNSLQRVFFWMLRASTGRSVSPTSFQKPFLPRKSFQGGGRQDTHTKPTQKSLLLHRKERQEIVLSRKKLYSPRQDRATVQRSEHGAVLASSRVRQHCLNSLSVSRAVICESFQWGASCRHLITDFCRGEVSAEKHFLFCLLPACLVPHTSFSFIKMDGSIKIERK